MKLYSDELMPYTKEFFMQKKPTMQRIVIWILAFLLLATFIFLSFAQFEEVIKLNGYIRPINNISTVSNAVTGRIETISYSPGQHVKKEQLLLEIDSTQYETQRQSLLSQMQEEEKKLNALYAIDKSIKQNKNFIPEDYEEANLRYNLWRVNLEKLDNYKKLYLNKYKQEINLPENMTTVSKIQELKNQYDVSCNDYDNLDISFRYEIAEEISSLEISKKINSEKLKQIEDSIRFTKVLAPIDGIIQEISTFNKNDWVQEGQQLFNIIPSDKNSLKVELLLPAKQAGKLAEGLTVKMRFPSLPYHEFGGAEGKILTIDPDNTRSNNGEAYFLVITDINKQFLEDKKGVVFPLRVGLEVDARIITAKKTILLFILEKIDLWF